MLQCRGSDRVRDRVGSRREIALAGLSRLLTVGMLLLALDLSLP
jgi:hypothetical protein